MIIHSRSRTRMRCSQGRSGCGARFTLRQHPSQYERAPQCPCCHGTSLVIVEEERRREAKRQGVCRCHMYPFPHRRGGLPMCVYGPLHGQEPSRDDLAAYDQVISAPRHGHG